MILTAYVKIWGMTAGALAWDDSTGSGEFEFTQEFIRAGLDLSPIMMPLRDAKGRVFSFPGLRRSDSFRGLPGLLADVLPDRFGNLLIDAWLARQGRAPGTMNPVEMLCYIGKRGMGALEFEPPLPHGSDASSRIEIDEMVELANEILSGRARFFEKLTGDRTKALESIIKIGSSAGGARAKALIAFNEQTGEIRSGQADAPEGFRHWILKFDGVSDKQSGTTDGYGRVELAYSRMARDCGIDMSECRLLEENGRAHFMTRRFDRTEDGAKIHMQSLCAMRHLDFTEVNAFAYEQLFETARILGLPYPIQEQIYRRMVLNVLSRNCDDHTKNFAFVMDRSGKWDLSPAFDLCYTFNPGNPWVSHQALSVNGKRKGITREDLLETASQMNIRKAAAIIDQADNVVRSWKTYAAETGVRRKLADEIEGNLNTM
jgi:serine/threonine-protein kinase HipA